jgi:hypothetical protein
MAFSPGSNKNITLVNTSNAPQTIILPLLSDYPDRFLYVKDVTTLAPGSTYSNYITIQTSNSDIFENGSNSVQIATQFTNYTFYANPYTNCWNTLNYYDTSFLQLKDVIPQLANVITGFSNLNSYITDIFGQLNSLFSGVIPQQTSYFVDLSTRIEYNTITYPYGIVSIPLDPIPTIDNPGQIERWSLTTSFSGLLSDSGVSMATYINISNADINEDVSGNLFNKTTPYICRMPALAVNSVFPTRTTFTYKDTYNTYNILTSNNILSNAAPYSINMYVCIIDDSGKNNTEYTFLDGKFEVSLTPISQ